MHKPTIYEKYIKRLLGLLFSLIGLLFLLPLLIIISVFIKMDSKGPVLFKQERIGKNGDTFKIYKFRSMVENAEKMGSGIKITGEEDFRITKVGSFLRKTGMDELPQLINILKGEMGFVGPRPTVVYHPYDGYEKYPDEVKKRFNIRPGVTGLAQVKVRNSVSWSRRFEYDLEYISNVNFKNDVKILFATLGVLNSTDFLYLKGDDLDD